MSCETNGQAREKTSENRKSELLQGPDKTSNWRSSKFYEKTSENYEVLS